MNPDTDDKKDIYKHYIDYEIRGDSSSTVRMICERAITDFPLHLTFWTEYITFSQKRMDQSHALSIIERAVRNITWSADLWQKYLLALEKAEKPKDQITGK